MSQAEPLTLTRPGTGMPVAALVLGATAMGASPIFVRLADVGPFASAFWRAGLALPLLLVWAAVEARLVRQPLRAVFRFDRAIVLAGIFFAGDLCFWHLSILNTSVANATLLATMMPVWVVAGSAVFLGERPQPLTIAGMALCIVGALVLIGGNVSVSPERLMGDLFGLVTSMFFGAYIVAIRHAGRRAGPGRITFLSSAVTALILLGIAFVAEPALLPASLGGIGALLGLAFISHSGGQGLLAFALGHLPAAFSSLVIFAEVIAAAALGWLVLGEAIGWMQTAGGVLIVLGIYIARPRRGEGAAP